MSTNPWNIVVHINGWPGTGKLTIARALTRRLGGRLMDNHTLLNPAEALFERNDPRWSSLRQEIRLLVFSYMARIEPPAVLVLTDALADDTTDRAKFDEYVKFAAGRSARLVSVIAECDVPENVRRLQSAERVKALKLTNPEILGQLRSRYRLLRPEGLDIIDLNVTSLSAEAAAEQIERLLYGLI